MVNGTLPPQGVCGIQAIKPSIDGSTLNPSMRIIQGQVAVPDSWPWTVSLRSRSGSKIGNHFCAGSLIYSQYVVTAAHCLVNKRKESVAVIIGENKLDSPIDSSHIFYVQDMLVNQKFNEQQITDDIALIKLARVASTTTKICLPDANYTRIFFQRLVLVGWGSTTGSNAVSDLSNDLLQTILKVDNSDSACQPTSSNYCAVSNGNSNACYGDSGGPLMFYVDGQWILYGLTSYIIASSGLCLPNFPSYYTAIPVFLDWIGNAIATLS
jgi:endopeptidase E